MIHITRLTTILDQLLEYLYDGKHLLYSISLCAEDILVLVFIAILKDSAALVFISLYSYHYLKVYAKLIICFAFNSFSQFCLSSY